jgi:hypothetical protein
MRIKIFLPVFVFLVFFSTNAYSGFFDDIFKRFTGGELQQGLTEETIVSGLKEALSIGAQNAVTTVSRLDGYFANESIKVLMPQKLQGVAAVLGNLGLQQQVDSFVLSMNRAAERAAPEAAAILVNAITEMTFQDAKNILNGGDTAATDYFRAKASDRLYAAFEPIVVSAMDEVGVTRYYGQIVEKYEAVPFMTMASLDLDAYVTNGALEGLFYMVAQEEKKIRQDPAARVTELLKTVFGK